MTEGSGPDGPRLAAAAKTVRHNAAMFLTLPTLLTWARIVAIPLIVGVYYLPGVTVEVKNLSATVMFIVFALTDWADGWLARRLNHCQLPSRRERRSTSRSALRSIRRYSGHHSFGRPSRAQMLSNS